MKAKYLLLAAGLLAGAGGCRPSAQEQTAAAVSRYMRATSHDPGSYEVVRFRMQPYTRQDSIAYAARAASKRLLPAGQAAPPRQPRASGDTTRVAWLVHLAYRIRNGYAAVTNEQGTFVVYPPDVVVPIAE